MARIATIVAALVLVFAACVVATSEVAASACTLATPDGRSVDLTQVVPSAFLTDVDYPLGIKLRWWIGVSPCHLQNATLPANKTCPPGYAFAVSPLKFLAKCSENFPIVLAREWLPGANAARVVVQNPADGRVVNTTIACDAAAGKNLTLTAAIHTPDAHHYYVNAASSAVCPQ